MLRPSLLDPDVPVSVHPAPDVLSFRFCSCGYNRDSFRVQLEGLFSSSCCDFRLRGVDVLSLHLAFLSHSDHMNGFAFLRL